jgi:membrane protease YdiL (CAAX protease family)
MVARTAGQLLTFCIGAALSIAAGIATAGFIVGLTGISGTDAAPLASALISALLLATSSWVLRRNGESLTALGLPTTRERNLEFGFGVLVGAVMFLAVIATQSAVVGAAWEFQGLSGLRGALSGIAVVAAMVLAEELLFRGLGLSMLRRMYGDWAAILLTSFLFGAYHLIGSGDWAMGAVFRFLTSAAGGVVFAWAAVRSGGIALPLGLHLGGNWVQASVAVFVPQDGAAHVLWRIPITSADVASLTAPDLPVRLPYFIAIGVTAAITWRFLRLRPPGIRETRG